MNLLELESDSFEEAYDYTTASICHLNIFHVNIFITHAPGDNAYI